MLFGTKNSRPAVKSSIQCALDRDAAHNASAVAADACEARGPVDAKQPEAPMFNTRKPSNTMSFNVDLLEGWTRA